MLFNLLLKTQHFAIPLSVTVSEAKNFSSPFLQMMIKPGKSRKGEKPTSEKRRKINELNASKIEMNGTFFIWKFFSRAIEISRQTVLLRIAFLQNTFNRWVSLPRHGKGSRGL